MGQEAAVTKGRRRHTNLYSVLQGIDSPSQAILAASALVIFAVGQWSDVDVSKAVLAQCFPVVTRHWCCHRSSVEAKQSTRVTTRDKCCGTATVTATPVTVLRHLQGCSVLWSGRKLRDALTSLEYNTLYFPKGFEMCPQNCKSDPQKLQQTIIPIVGLEQQTEYVC